MKRKIFVLFVCMLMCIQLFITTAHADAYFDWYYCNNQKYDLNDISTIYYAASMSGGVVHPPFDLDDSFSEKKLTVFFNSSKSSMIIIYLSNEVDCLTLDDECVLSTDNGQLAVQSRSINYNASSFGSSSSSYHNFTTSFDAALFGGFGDMFYSSVDIVDVNGDIKYDHTYGPEDYQYHYAPDIDVSYYPELSLDMDFSYENPGGSRDETGRPIPSIEYNYNITGTVDYNGSLTYQYCVLVSESPPEVVFEEGINPTQDKYFVDFKSYKNNTILTVVQDTYYWCTYNNPNYGDIDFVQAKGVIGWFVASPGKDSYFTLNLQRLPGFSPDKTYYITLWGYERPEGETATFTYLPAAYSFDEIETQGHSIQLVDCQAFGTTKDLIDYEDTSDKNQFTQSDHSYVDLTGTGDKIFNGGIIPESAVETPTTDGITGPITAIKPSTGGNVNYGDSTFSGIAGNFKSFVLFCQSCYSVMPVQVSNLLFYLVCVLIAFAFVVIVIKLIPR